MLHCFDFLLCFSRELGRSRRSRCSRAFAKAVNELLHTQFQWVLTGRWLIQKLEKSLSSLKSKILIIRCGCLVVVCGHLMFVVYVYILNLFQTVVDPYSRIENIFDDLYLLNIIQKIIWSFILFFVFCFVCMCRCFHSFNFEYIRKTSIHNCNSCVDMKYNCRSICAFFIQ